MISIENGYPDVDLLKIITTSEHNTLVVTDSVVQIEREEDGRIRVSVFDYKGGNHHLYYLGEDEDK